MTAFIFQHQNQASFVLGTPSPGTTYDWYPVVDKTVVPRIGPTAAVTRAGATATYFDADGVLQTAGANTLRFDHDPATLESKGPRLEEGRTNLFLYSEDIGNAAWVNNWSGGVTETLDDAAFIDGNTVMDKIERVDGGGDAVNQDLTLATATDYIFSAYVKNDDAVATQMLVYDTVGAAYEARQSFSWSSGVPSVATATESATGAGVQEISDGIYRLYFKFTSDGTNTNHRMILSPASGAGDVNGNGIWVGGFQCEAGGFVTSYIKTTSAAVARATDQLNVTDMTFLDTGDGDTIQGTWFFWGSSFDGDGSSRMFQLDDGGNSDFIKFVRDASLNLTVQSGTTAGNGATVAGGAIAANAEFRGAMSYEQDNVHIAQDGTAYGPDTTADFPLNATMTTLSIGHRNGGLNSWNGYFKRLWYKPVPSTQAQIEALTNPSVNPAAFTSAYFQVPTGYFYLRD